ncbi:uncharacterized protein K444DRAFT_605971 [Hyaloscypha bicolor E]|uniref:Uncharacterized protein n=1 Tax=Hyaloscypha bicolor E TaxID=1095630 RepID=A0A2J6TVM7_9HELO|nr:uncharacterized protein K444DRAFT_605971 [Hyaloscypha bicolor E]PMD67008.1 hypothetical protein K444DRAFT_605971 [Hyaloscypha bicolor E]
MEYPSPPGAYISLPGALQAGHGNIYPKICPLLVYCLPLHHTSVSHRIPLNNLPDYDHHIHLVL